MATWLTELPTPFGRLCTCPREDAWDRAKMHWLAPDLAINLSKKPTKGAGLSMCVVAPPPGISCYGSCLDCTLV